MEMTPLSWSELGQHFVDEDKAREYMEFLRWGSGPTRRRNEGNRDRRSKYLLRDQRLKALSSQKRGQTVGHLL